MEGREVPQILYYLEGSEMEILNIVVLVVSSFLILVGLLTLLSCYKERKRNKYLTEYKALQELKPKLDYFNIKLIEVSEGQYKFVQCAKSGKPVFQIRKRGKGVDFVKMVPEFQEHKKDVMTASHLNKVLA